MAIYDAVDLMWDSTTGDFIIGHNGDIASTEDDPLMAIAQEIYTRVKSDRGDFKEASLIGSSLSDFVGEPNTRDLGTSIKKRLLSSLTSYGTINEGDISIEVFPVAKDKIAISIELRVSPTIGNRNSRVLKRVFIYSYNENNVFARG